MKLKSNMSLKRKIVLLINCIVLIVIIVFAVIFIRRYNIENKYSFYKEKMDIYDYSKLYDNHKSTSYEKVTKLEAIKFVIAASNNTTNLERLILAENYDNETELWLKCAYQQNIVSENEVNVENCTENATYIEFITYLYNAKINILEIKDSIDVQVLYKDYNKYSDNQKVAIESLLESNILENEDKKISGNKKLIKGIVSKTIYEYVTKLNTITVNRNEDKVVTEENNLPSNADEYPYILESVDKEVYEQEFSKTNADKFKAPSDYYKLKRKYYYTLKYRCESYYNNILNIDYNTFDVKQFIESLKPFSIDSLSEDEVNEYYNYIKENKIIIKGKATAQMPAIYSDGFYCRVRLNLQFEVISSDTNENLLIFEHLDGNTVKYNNKTYDIYIDSKLSYTLTSDCPFVSSTSIDNILLPMSKDQFSEQGGE